jgi:hypothetical protein
LSNRKKIVLIPIALLFVLTFFYKDINKNNSLSTSQDNVELSLKEAINLGLNKARKWNKKAALLSVTSVDETMGGTRGNTGRRIKWTIFFMAPDSEEHLLIGISNGMVKDVKEIIGPKNVPTIELNDIKFDSPDLVNLAKKKFDLDPGEDWATGYHFLLSIIDGKITGSVVGVDKNKLYTMIDIDPSNCRVTSAKHKEPKGGGLISVNNETKSHKTTKPGYAIFGITAEEGSLVTWGDRKPREFNATVQPFLDISYDNGESWSELDIKDYITNAWFNSQKELFISTATEVFSYLNLGRKPNKILSLEGEINYLDYSTNNNIAILSDKTIYSTENQGYSWNKSIVPKNIRSINISDQGDLVIFTQEREILLKQGDKWNSIYIPYSREKLLDMKIIKNILVIATDSGILVKEIQGDNWRNIKTNEQIDRLIKKGNRLLGITNGGTIKLISLGGDFNVKLENLFESNDRLILDLEIADKKLFVATTPEYLWEELNPSSVNK